MGNWQRTNEPTKDGPSVVVVETALLGPSVTLGFDILMIIICIQRDNRHQC